MHAVVIRFADVTAERISNLVAERQSAGPPPGVDASRFELFFDEAQGTAVFVGSFETEEKMRDASAVFAALDSSALPGTQVSVDLCEVKFQEQAG